MNRKLVMCLASLLVTAAFAVAPVMAQALTVASSGSQTPVSHALLSATTDSFCVNPKAAGFKTTLAGGAIDYAGLTTASGTGSAFPDSGEACERSPTPVELSKPGESGKASVGVWTGAIKEASWVGLEKNGNETSNAGSTTAPRYYIYDATFELSCASQAAGAKLEGTMFADNYAGAFLNGYPIGHTPYPGAGMPPATQLENFQPTLSHPEGWPFGTTAHFNSGANTLQVVVLDVGGSTGVDFAAKVTAPACPHWIGPKGTEHMQTRSWG